MTKKWQDTERRADAGAENFAVIRADVLTKNGSDAETCAELLADGFADCGADAHAVVHAEPRAVVRADRCAVFRADLFICRGES